MDRVHGVVHGPGPQGWSMDPGPCFVYVHFQKLHLPPDAHEMFVAHLLPLGFLGFLRRKK